MIFGLIILIIFISTLHIKIIYNVISEYEYKANLFMEAVNCCLKDSYCRSRQFVLKRLIQSGIDLNVILDSTGFNRNALHVSVDKTTGDANQSLDLETCLIRGGCNVMVKDSLSRYP